MPQNTTDTEIRQPDPWLKISDLSRLTKASRSTLYAWMKRGVFPSVEKIGPSLSGLRTSTYLEWENDPQAWAEAHKRDAA